MRTLALILMLLAAPAMAQQVPSSAAQMQLSFVPLVKEAAPGDMSEQARFVLADWRDTVRDASLVSALRFTVEATLATYDPAQLDPAQLTPQISPQIEEGAPQ